MASQYYNGGSWIRPEKRLAIYLRDSFTCVYCGTDLRNSKPTDVTLDHLISKSQWAKMGDVARGNSGLNSVNVMTNLVTACRSCNSSRGDKLLEDFAPGGALNRIAYLVQQPLNGDLARAIISGEIDRLTLDVETMR